MNTIFEKFSEIKIIKQGGFGKIYKAKHNENGYVAIKEVTTSKQLSKSVIFNEIQILSEIKSDFFPKFYEFYSFDDKFYIILEYVDGQNLKEYVENNEDILETESVIKLFIQICKAVHSFHRLGFIHRDIKPSNFMITKNRDIKLIDFGISFSLINPKPVVNEFKALTKDFASPEQLGKESLDIRSDVFSLGKTLDYILNKKTRIIEKTEIIDTNRRIQNVDIKSDKYDEKLLNIIKKATDSDKTKRYDSVNELLQELEQLENSNSKVDKNNYRIKLTAGYVPSFILKYKDFNNFNRKTSFRINVILNKNQKLVDLKEKKIFDVLSNFVKRGNPTLCSIKIEEHYLKKYSNSIHKVEDNDNIVYEFNKTVENESIINNIIKETIRIGKFQRILCFLLSNGLLDISGGEWTFNVDDEFTDLFTLAAEDLLETINHFYNLNDLLFKKPKILISKTANNVITYQNKLYNSKYNEIYIKIEDLNDFYEEPVETNYNIDYKIDEKKHLDSLTYFLQNIFRKVKFRNGQIEIIKRALSLKNTIGLLPTGAGKSLCYQFVACMQPGIILVIEPIKSLIVDQTYNIKKFLISKVDYLTKDLVSQERDEIQEKFKKGILKILFISPERLQNDKFRNYLKECTDKFHINFCIIDEAHCVSEWGHDFRASYLNLSRTIRETCCKNGRIPVFYALTATASEIVLQDIKSDLELDHNDKDAVIRNLSLNRDELEFIVKKVPSNLKFEELKNIFQDLSKIFNYNSPEIMVKEKKVPGLIFCPHVNTTNYSIVKVNKLIGRYLNLTKDNSINVDKAYMCPKCQGFLVQRNSRNGKSFWGCSNFPNCIYKSDNPLHNNVCNLIELFEETRIFGGDNIKGMNDNDWIKYKNEGQFDFIENRASLMICTKSFGMGIDKRDIRFTIHYNLPQSIESFYQEAGRAGRDGNKAYCYIIFSDDNPKYSNNQLDPSKPADKIWGDNLSNVDSDVGRNLYFQKNSFNGQNNDLTKIENFLNNDFFDKLKSLELYKKFNRDIFITNDLEINDFEKILFRLKIIGLVEDYTIDYQYKGRKYSINFYKTNNYTYIENLKNYLTKQGVSVIDQFLKEKEVSEALKSFPDTIKYCVSKVLEFVYSKIEPQRRRSLLNLLEAVRSDNNNDFREKVLMYLDPSEEINLYFRKFPHSTDYQEWLSIIRDSKEKNKVNNFLGVALRILESYPDNAGLLYITFGLRCLILDELYDTILNDFKAFVNSSDKNYKIDFTNNAIIEYLNFVLKFSENNSAIESIIKILIKRKLQFIQIEQLLKIKTGNREYQKLLSVPALKKIEKKLRTIRER